MESNKVWIEHIIRVLMNGVSEKLHFKSSDFTKFCKFINEF